MANITYKEARILKSAGKRIDVKVTIKILPGNVVVAYMRRDGVFHTYKSAARFLRNIKEAELDPTGVRS